MCIYEFVDGCEWFCVRARVCVEYILLSEEILLLSNRNLFCD